MNVSTNSRGAAANDGDALFSTRGMVIIASRVPSDAQIVMFLPTA
ncbi:MAG: hypothetical protein ACTIKQ_06185 [Microbacterium sp.]